MPDIPSSFGGGGLFPIARQAQSRTIHSNGATIIRATLNSTEVFVSGDTATYELSANGGDNWQTVTKGVEITFTYQGTELQWRIVLLGIGGANTYIDDLTITVVET